MSVFLGNTPPPRDVGSSASPQQHTMPAEQDAKQPLRGIFAQMHGQLASAILKIRELDLENQRLLSLNCDLNQELLRERERAAMAESRVAEFENIALIIQNRIAVTTQESDGLIKKSHTLINLENSNYIYALRAEQDKTRLACQRAIKAQTEVARLQNLLADRQCTRPAS